MEYVQMTLNDWLEMKEKIRRELQSVKHSFVRIGYALRKIEDGKLYEQDGYKSIAEFARAEYGLEPSTTSRFISINREYSIDGYSERLRPEYEQMGRSQLEEMLKLPAADRAMIGAETPREDIRELKRFNAAGPETGIADDVKGVVEKFFHDNPEALNDLFAALEEGDVDAAHVSEIINPSGSRAYKKGLYFLMMYENRVSVKKFGQDPQDMGWEEFAGIAKEIFADAADGDRTWKNYFGGEEDAEDEKGQAVTGQGKDGMDALEVIPENEEKEAAYGKGDPEDKADTEPDGSAIKEAEYAHPEPLPTEVRIHAEQEPENEPEEQIAPAQSSAESAENLDIPEVENAADRAEKITEDEPELASRGIPEEPEIDVVDVMTNRVAIKDLERRIKSLQINKGRGGTPPESVMNKSIEVFKMAIVALENMENAVDFGYLSDWYISSVSSDDEPVWTEAHIEELDRDFILIPKRVKGE